MKTQLHLKKMKQLKSFFSFALFFVFLMTYAQESPLPTSNTLINTVTLEYFFDEQVDPPSKTNYASNLLDDDSTTDWAASNNTGGELIFDLGGAYDLAEMQYVTVSKAFAYEFQIWVSTTGNLEADFSNITPAPNGNGNAESDLNSEAYKSFDLGTTIGATYVKIKCYGRLSEPSTWNTISELKFYSEATASVKDNELSGFKLFPNPSNNYLELSDLNNKVSRVQIVSLLGKVILSKPIDSFEKELRLNTSFLANGVYLVKLSDASGSINASKKLVIQH